VSPYMARMNVKLRSALGVFPQGYGEGEEVALAVALTVALTVALRSVGVAVGLVLWRVVAGRVLSGRVLSGRVLSLGPARSVLSMVVAEGTVRAAGGGVGVLGE
jgi:hypothetical protein